VINAKNAEKAKPVEKQGKKINRFAGMEDFE